MKKNHFASVPFFILILITLTGLSGCVSSTSQTTPVPAVSETKQTTIDTSTWIEESIEKGFVFSYPPDLNFAGGGDVDHGSYSWVTGEYPEDVYFEFFDSTLWKCQFSDPEKCEIDAYISATPEEVFAITLQSFITDDFYFPAENINIAGTIGKKFRIREDLNDGIARTSVVFYNAQGVYLISDYQETPNAELFDTFLGTFRKE